MLLYELEATFFKESDDFQGEYLGRPQIRYIQLKS